MELEPELPYCEVTNSAPLIEVDYSPRRIRQKSSSKTQVMLSIAVVIFAILSLVFMTLYFRSCDGKNSLPNSGPDNVCQRKCTGSKTSNNTGSWEFIGQGCVGARNNQFKEIRYVGPSRFIGAIKLVHRSGYVACSKSVRSNWGCAAGETHLTMIVTDPKNRIIYPSPRLVKINPGGWYTLPGYTSSSPQLIFTDFGYPKYLRANEKLRIWHGEDLKGYTESDNHGSTCMDIYAYFVL